MDLLRCVSSYHAGVKTHVNHNGRPMCGDSGDYEPLSGDAPTCTRCMVEAMLIPRQAGKIGKRRPSQRRNGPHARPTRSHEVSL